MTKRRTTKLEKTDEDALVVAERVLSMRIAKKASEKNLDDREFTRLTRSLVGIREALRAARKLELKATGEITRASWVEYYTRATPGERGDMRRDLDAADRRAGGGGVFG